MFVNFNAIPACEGRTCRLYLNHALAPLKVTIKYINTECIIFISKRECNSSRSILATVASFIQIRSHDLYTDLCPDNSRPSKI